MRTETKVIGPTWLIVAACCLGIVATAERAVAKKWFEGGTLHGRTMAEWTVATEENRLASTADLVFALTDPAISGQMDLDDFKKPAADVVVCVNGLAGESKAAEMKISDMTVLCMAMIKGTYPFFLTRQQ